LVASESLDPLPEPLARLVKARGANVFRYRPHWEHSHFELIDSKRGEYVPISGAAFGTGPKCLPFYLMIYGDPESVPWSLQFILGANRCVGRLSIAGEALENYVTALLADFPGSPSDPYSVLVWAVDHGQDDITRVLRNQIADKLRVAVKSDAEMKCTFLDGMSAPSDATGHRLIAALTKEKPGLIVTTSHGTTGPSANGSDMREMLGLPVDELHKPLDPIALVADWQPSGAIWFCHACCSAGSDAPSNFSSLFDESTEMHRLLTSIAALGPSVAPWPERLLGAKAPLRAFIGHVEPTFDFTLQNPLTGESMTSALVSALYPGLFRRKPRMPLGFAFRGWFNNRSPMFTSWDFEQSRYDGKPEVVGKLLLYQLAMRDIQGTVILGDPAVLVPLRKD
jgi:hypothetical protein